MENRLFPTKQAIFSFSVYFAQNASTRVFTFSCRFR